MVFTRGIIRPIVTAYSGGTWIMGRREIRNDTKAEATQYPRTFKACRASALLSENLGDIF
jgi:hypothetical protein